MKDFKGTKIIAVDTGYGNIKTANHCFKTGIIAYDSEPLFTKDMLIHDGRYYIIGEGHKEFVAEKQTDNDYYLLTLVGIAEDDLQIIRMTAAEYVNDIFRRLREHGYDERTMTLYITGGGGCLVKNFYQHITDRMAFIDDICAAAKGYEFMAEIQCRAGKAI